MKAYKMVSQNKNGKVHYVKEGTFVKDDIKKLHYYQFEVPKGTREIQFSFELSPRVLKDPEKNRELIKGALREYIEEYSEDDKVKLFEWLRERFFNTVYPIRNLLDISFYDSEGNYLGKLNQAFPRSGKFALLNEKRASLGLTPRKIKPGTWIVEIAVASIVTDKCHYKMEIFLCRKESELPNKVKGKIVVSSTTEKKKKEIKEKGYWYAGELHVHSNHSDGKNTINEIIQGAKKEGLDFFALTDHDVVSGYDFIPQNGTFLIIKGIEITTFYGHALALGVKSIINWRHNGKIRNINDIINEVHAQGALFAIAHPFHIGDPVCAGCKWKFKETDYRLVDMMEVWRNSWKLGKIENYRSFKLWDKLLNEGLRITGISSRDWHNVEERKNGHIPKTFVHADSLSEDGILEGLRMGHVFVSSGPLLFFSAKHKDKRYECGDEIKLIEKEPINFQIQIKNLKKPSRLQIIKNGLKFFDISLAEGKDQRVILSDLPEKSSWYRCEIYTEKDKELLCFANPIS
ncbi:CehA/McbA family metallohydrolase, partial [Candidatus Aerophobetes bacterium]|nr:CehA/McbA family metallohydrolase [Candidatus Aerophobetes bacterium]